MPLFPGTGGLWAGLVRRLREDVARVAGEAVRRAVRSVLGGNPSVQEPLPEEAPPPPGLPRPSPPVWRRVLPATWHAMSWWLQLRAGRPLLAASAAALCAGVAAAPAGLAAAVLTSACLGLAVLAGSLLALRPGHLV